MKFQEKTSSTRVISLGVTVLLLIVLFLIISLIFKINYLQAKNKFQASGQTPSGRIQPVTKNDFTIGNPNANVTLIEYSDFECPDCQYFHITLKKLLNIYGNKLFFVSRRYPLPQNQNAQKEAEAVLCVGKIGGNNAFWAFSDKIFEKIIPTAGGTGISLNVLPIFAKEVGVGQKEFQKCLDQGEMAKIVKAERDDGVNGGINQLPGTFIIDNKKGNIILLAGNQTLDVMKTIIDQALAL